MNLSEVRLKINEVDESMKALFDSRMNCSKQIAEVKLETGDDVFKPDREQAILEKFSDDAEYHIFIKKVMQISRKYQYGLFADNGELKDKFTEKLTESNRKVFEEGGKLELSLQGDITGQNALKPKDIISVVADTSLNLESLELRDDKIKLTFNVDNSETSKKEAFILAYMLYMETI